MYYCGCKISKKSITKIAFIQAMKKNMKIALFLAILAVIGAGYFAYINIYKRNTAFNENAKLIYIPTGSAFADVVSILQKEKIVSNIKSFKWLSEKKKYTLKIRPGCYRIDKGMSTEAIVNLLRSGIQQPVEVKFNNMRLPSQLAAAISRQIETDSAQLYTMLTDDKVASSYGFDNKSFIAMFIPNTYQFYWNTDAEGFLKRMAREYKTFWNALRKSKAAKWGLSPTEITTLASIVQEETNMSDDKPVIAGVYLNRLRKNMALEADPTLKFALQDFALKRILNKDKEVDSPYNTYKNTGLPPGPICIPDVTTIDAVLDAQEHNYLFFCARDDLSGHSNFAQTYSEHLENARKYQAALDKLNIKR